MKVVITNTTLLNGGDAAINEATMLILRHALGDDTSFVCYDADASTARRYHPELAIRPALFGVVEATMPRWLPRKLAQVAVLAAAALSRRGDTALRLLPEGLRLSLADYRAADIVVSAGGTYLVDRYRLAPKIFDFLATLALGRPLVLFTQSVGPLPGGRDGLLLRFALRRAVLIMVRDDRSQRELARIGVGGPAVARYPDAAFALANPVPAMRGREWGTPPRIAVSVRDWPFLDADGRRDGMARYLDEMAGFIRCAVERDGARVTLISTCQGIPEYWTDDAGTAARVIERLPVRMRTNVTIDPDFRQPSALIRRLRDFDVVVATRMHMGILALCAGVPVVPIAYEFKTRELFDALGAGDLVSDIETVDAEHLYAACRDALCQHAKERTDALRRKVVLARFEALASGRLAAAAALPGSWAAEAA